MWYLDPDLSCSIGTLVSPKSHPQIITINRVINDSLCGWWEDNVVRESDHLENIRNRKRKFTFIIKILSTKVSSIFIDFDIKK